MANPNIVLYLLTDRTIMILGISSFTYPWAVGVPGSVPQNPLDEQSLIDIAGNSSVRCLQIGDNLPLHLISPDRLTAFRQKARSAHVRLEIGARALTRDSLQRYIEIAAFLEAPLLRFVIDGEQYTPTSKQVIKIVSEFIPELTRLNITLGIENHDRFTSQQLAAIIEHLNDDHVGICLDCVNSLGAGEGLEQVTDTLLPYVVNVHLKDFSIQRLQHKMGFIVTGSPLGKGMLKTEELLDKLACSPCKSAILEQWIAPESSLDKTIEKEKLWAEEGLRFLHGLPYFKKHQTII